MTGAAQTVLAFRLPARLGRRLCAAFALTLTLAAVYMLWFRDLPLFAVKTVHIEGIPAGAEDSGRLQRALTDAGREMTTLHVRQGLLEKAAAEFPLVASVRADAGFPNELTIRVSERRPVALIEAKKGVAVADDGTILRGMAAAQLDLPRLPLTRIPARRRLVGTTLQQALVLGAAPKALLRYLDRSSYGSQGVVVVLDDGVELRFGGASKARDKWRAGAAVLADPGLSALDYVDLTAPRRPAVGGAGHLLAPAP